MSDFAAIIHEVFLFTLLLSGLLVGSLVLVSLLPEGNPLKQLLSALSARIGVTLAMTGMAVPIEFIPGVDALYDIATPIFLLYYWFTFFRDAIRLGRMSMQPEPLLYETFTPPAPLPHRERLPWNP
jgi:hypothetical protein